MGSRFLRDRQRTVAGSGENQVSLFQPELYKANRYVFKIMILYIAFMTNQLGLYRVSQKRRAPPERKF